MFDCCFCFVTIVALLACKFKSEFVDFKSNFVEPILQVFVTHFLFPTKILNSLVCEKFWKSKWDQTDLVHQKPAPIWQIHFNLLTHHFQSRQATWQPWAIFIVLNFFTLSTSTNPSINFISQQNYSFSKVFIIFTQKSIH